MQADQCNEEIACQTGILIAGLIISVKPMENRKSRASLNKEVVAADRVRSRPGGHSKSGYGAKVPGSWDGFLGKRKRSLAELVIIVITLLGQEKKGKSNKV